MTRTLTSIRLSLALVLLTLCGASAFAQAAVATASASVTPAAPFYTDPVTAQFVVNGNRTGDGTYATGNVQYTLDMGTQQNAALSFGKASAALGTLAVGQHNLVYRYLGDGTYPATGNQTLTFTVSDVSTAIRLGSFWSIARNLGGGINYVGIDSKDNAYFPDTSNNLIHKVTPSGAVTNVTAATGLNNPAGIAFDASDNLYLADAGNNRLLEITAAGTQLVLPVTGLSNPRAISFDAAKQNLYIADQFNQRLLRYNITTQVTTSIVTGVYNIQSVALDAAGNIYYGTHYSYSDGALYKRDTTGYTSIVPGFASPNGISVDAFGNIYVGDGAVNALYRIDASGHTSRLSVGGNGANGSAIDSKGNVYLAQTNVAVFTPGPAAYTGSSEARTGGIYGYLGPDFSIAYQVGANQTLSSFTVPAVTPYGTVGGPSCTTGLCVESLFTRPQFPGLNTSYVTANFSDNSHLQQIIYGPAFQSEVAFTPGNLSTVTGSLGAIAGATADQNGVVYVSDTTNKQVYKIAAGVATSTGFTGLQSPTQLSIDGGGNIYVLDTGNSHIVRLGADGVQSVAFTLPFESQLTSLTAFVLDGATNLYLGGASTGGGGAVYEYGTNGVFSRVTFTAGVPSALAVDAFNQTSNVYSIDATGELDRIDRFGTRTSLATDITGATSLAVDPGTTAYVATGAAALTTVTPAGVTGTFATAGVTNAVAVSVDKNGSLGVADGAAHSVTLVNRSTQAYDFGTILTNSTSAPVHSVVTNVGNNDLGSFGGFPADNYFKLATGTTNACVLNTPFAIAASCSLDYTFTSGATAGQVTESLSLQDSTPTQSANFTVVNLNFMGTAVAPAPVAGLSPTSVSFGSTSASASGAAQTITLSNTGNAALTIASITITGDNASAFAQTNNCGTSVVGGGSCIISVTFSPGMAGSNTATLTVTDNSGNTSGSAQTAGLSGTGVTPTATLTPSTFSFASKTIGTSTTNDFTLTNTSTVGMSVGTIQLVAEGTNSYTKTTTCGTSLAAGATCTITVRFAPSATGTINTTLTVTDDAGSQAATITGTGAAPTATLTPGNYSFGTQTTGTSATQDFTLTNTSPVSIDIGTVQLTAEATNSYTKTTNCGATLAPGAACAVTVLFQPTATGAINTTLTITDAAGTQTAAITGTGAAPAIPVATLAPATVAFGSVVSGSHPAQMLTLSNTGNAVLAITSITLSGADSGAYGVSNTCNGSVAAGAACSITVTLNASTPGTYNNASVIVTDNASPSNQTTSVTAAVTGVPQATLSPATVTFGGVTQGATATSTLTLTNPGNAALTITSIAVGGANATSFTQANTCGTSLAAGASCSVTVSLNTAAAGTFAATLTVTDNASGSPQSSSLSGTVQAAVVTPIATTTAVTSSSPTSVAGTAVTFTAVVTPASGAAPAGSILFTDGTATLATVVLVNGRAAYTTAALAAGPHTITATYQPDATVAAPNAASGGSVTQTVTAAVVTTGTFTLTDAGATTYAITVSRGQQATTTLTVAPGPGFAGTVTLTCTGLPANSVCIFSPNPLTFAANGTQTTPSQNVTLALQTETTTLGHLSAPGSLEERLAAMAWLPCLLLAGLGARSGKLPRKGRLMLLTLMLGAIGAGLTGCGAGSKNINITATPPGSYNFSVVATSGAVSQTLPVALTIQ